MILTNLIQQFSEPNCLYFQQIMQNMPLLPDQQLLFQRIKEDTIKKIQAIKPQIECILSLDSLIYISDFKNANLTQKRDQNFTLQIRNRHVVQVTKRQTIKSNKTTFKDQIISAFQISSDFKFQIKRQFQFVSFSVTKELQPLPKPIGIVFYLDSKPLPLDFINQGSQEQLQKFAKILESKFVVQKNFNKIFKPLKKLGKGASATVIEGIDLRDNKKYAVKGFKKAKGFFIDKGIFSKQFQFMREIEHPNIVRLHSIFQTQNSLYMVLDRHDQNLYDFLINKGLNSEYDLKAIVKGTLQILQFLHSRDIMHRDVKPQNIMIKKGQFDQKQLLKRKNSIQPVLIDFGFAQYQNNEQFTLYRCGTPGFIAPEILKDYLIKQDVKDSFNSQVSVSNKKYSKACDIFSLGCLFHILLTSKMPFDGSNKKQLIKNNIEANINPMDKEYKLLDISAKKLMFKMLQKDPNKRITASEALKDDFFKLQMFNFRAIKFRNPLSGQSQHSQAQKSQEDNKIILFQ